MLNLPLLHPLQMLRIYLIVTFFHENQITYPWSTQDRDKEKIGIIIMDLLIIQLH